LNVPSAVDLLKVVFRNDRALVTHCFSLRVCKVTNIYVGNLSFRATEDDIRNAFSRYGQVTLVNIIMDRETGRSRGFAFVEMANADEANAAIEGLNQQEIAGRRVSINEARPRTERSDGGGRGYGGGGGGGGGGGRYSEGGGGYRGYGENSGGGGRYGESGGGGQRRSNYSRDRNED
jgi:cold-inducible RNA-binding protein